MTIEYTPLMEEIAEVAMRSGNRSPSGMKIIWDYVDADCWLDGLVEKFDNQDDYYAAFNAVADDMMGK